ncbi:hypothetical protein SSX86_001696 [Deinandra increscens subsp. villosa]|uniref:Uncharacterized protein n=1 Tax=Deinandra increscens subsp. villosa TaxID=3103831 RepID=A0AAP0DRV5_9ASTR
MLNATPTTAIINSRSLLFCCCPISDQQLYRCLQVRRNGVGSKANGGASKGGHVGRWNNGDSSTIGSNTSHVAPIGDSLVVLAYIPGEEDGEKNFVTVLRHDRYIFSRFAEPVYDSSVAWGPNGTTDEVVDMIVVTDESRILFHTPVSAKDGRISGQMRIHVLALQR